MKRFLALLVTLLLAASFACAEGGKQVTVYPVAVAPELYTAFPGGEGTAFEGGFKTGFGSAITFKGYDADGNLQFYGASDRGPSLDLFDKDGNEVENTKVFPAPDFAPVIGIITLKDGKAVVEEAITLKKADGTPLGGLPLPAGETGATGEIALDIYGKELTYDPEGFDPEGIAVDAQGNFWLGDEYGPFIGKFAPDGTLLKMYKPGDGLPEILKYRIANRGFESLTIAPSGKVFAVLQSVMDIEGKTQKTATFIRILELDPETGATKMYAYPVVVSEYSKPKNCKLGDAFAIDDTTLLIVEQGKLADKSMRNIIYKVDLTNATDLTGVTHNGSELEYTADAQELAGVITYASKEVYLDLRTLNWTAEKAEGICLTDTGAFVAIIEDDFGLAGSEQVEGKDTIQLLPNESDPSQIWVIESAPAAAENMKIDGVEVKYLLDPEKVLGEDGKPTEEALKLLGWTGKVKNRGMQFLDTAEKAYNEAGWSNRVRIKQGDDEYDITFKKRYAVTDGNIEAALALAAQDGFTADLEDYEAELDWGHSKLTLSIATETSVEKVGYDDTVLPNAEDSIAMVKAAMPEAVKAVAADIEKAIVCGPVYYPRYTGELAGMELDIEICPITDQKTGVTEYVCEVAFSTDTYEEAAAKKDEVAKILKDAGILLEQDGLKTNKILNAYLGE